MGKVVGSLQHRRRPRISRVIAGTCLFVIALYGPRNLAAPANPASSDPLLRVPGAGDPSIQASFRITPTPEADKEPEAPRDWRLVSGRSWQIVSAPGEAPDQTDLAEGTRGLCPAGMVEVRGKMKMSYVLDELQQQACTRWISRTFPERCADFDREKWLALSKDLPTSDMHFCIDRFEYPNRKGENPVIMVNWYEAKASCESAGKRLCSENEWTFACEGEEAMPYPYGYTRDANACVIDRPWKKYDDVALSARTTDAAKNELDRLWQGAPSGSHARCKSPFGVYDMTGNVDEWTRSSIPGERPSVLKGGYWGPVRTRCRPATKAHGETHTFYQQGFRCCANAK